MGVKILSKSGDSLADMYDVVGSIAGIERLETAELPIVHEMGATIFAERFSTTIRRLASGNMLQDTDFNLVLSNLPSVMTRLLGVVVLSNVVGRLLRAVVAVRSPQSGSERELPVWLWDGTTAETVTLQEDGAAVGDFDQLVGLPSANMLPCFTGGSGAPHPGQTSGIVLRGRTTGFGAGTVFVRGLFLIGFTQTTALSSRGVPIPSW